MRLFAEHDVLALPVTQVVPFAVEQEFPTDVAGVPMDGYLEWMRSCSRISATTLPALSVPAGFTAAGLPVGLQLVGAPRGERALLAIAAAVEELLGAGTRRPSISTDEALRRGRPAQGRNRLPVASSRGRRSGSQRPTEALGRAARTGRSRGRTSRSGRGLMAPRHP